MITDPIADMLTRIRNAITVKHTDVTIPASNEKLAVCDILVKQGYIISAEVVVKNNIKDIKVTLKYTPSGESAIQGLRRISKPGLRVYADADRLPKVIGGLGIAVISTNKGIMTDKEARKERVGGEVLAYVW